VDTDPRHTLGQAGERRAERFLKRQGYRILARRYRTPVGELDLVARDGDTIVFVEVKARRDDVHADPEDAVTPAKQRKLARAAAWYLRDKGLEERPCRFDVVTLVGDDPANATVEHIHTAFIPEG
jgi:putative endonuclease